MLWILRIFNIRKQTQTSTLRTAITASSTYTDQAPITPAVTPVQKYTPIDELARSALYAVKKDVSLQGIPRKNIKSLRGDLINGLISLF